MNIFSCIVHNVAFGLLETGVDSGYSRYNLYKDVLNIGACEFPSHLAPKFSVARDGSVAVYGGCNAYLVNANQPMMSYEEREEISKVWFENNSILIVCDTLVASRSRSTLSVQKEYWHNEIIISSLLKAANALVFQDLENGVFQLNIDDFSVCYSDYPFVSLT